jgi:hypothetical protein
VSTIDAEIDAAAAELSRLKADLGSAYWQDPQVKDLQNRLRGLIGRAGAWGEDRLPMHRRMRQAARLEHAYARLLWPGHADD